MKEFTGYEYLLIDIANNHWSGLDKATFEVRIAWTTRKLAVLEAEAENNSWKERPLYVKAVMALRTVQAGFTTGHLVGFDAIGSGMQIMSAVTGCVSGAAATGLVHDNIRSDPYTEITALMSKELKVNYSTERSKVKLATVAGLYGSKAEPEKLFGKDTPELEAFSRAVVKLAPGACELLQDLLKSWNAWELSHAWKLPDGYTAFVKVMQQVKQRIEIDEIQHHKFDYIYYINEGEKSGVKNAANVIHSIDAYVLRSLVRRCNYDATHVAHIAGSIQFELLSRSMNNGKPTPYGSTIDICPEVEYYMELYKFSQMADVVILPYLDGFNVSLLTTTHLQKLQEIIESMMCHKPFEISTVHDDFRCHPNNVNSLRKHYRDILAELAEGEILSDIFSQLNGKSLTYIKLSNNLGAIIRKSNYALS